MVKKMIANPFSRLALTGLSLLALLSCKPSGAGAPLEDNDLIPPPPPPPVEVYPFVKQSFSSPVVPEEVRGEMALESEMYIQSMVVPVDQIEEFRDNISKYVQLNTWQKAEDIKFLGNQFSKLVLASNISFSYQKNQTLLLEYQLQAGPEQGQSFSLEFNPFEQRRMAQQLDFFPELTPNSGDEVAIFLVARFFEIYTNPATPNFFYALNLDNLENSILTMP
jgi:hypothetical protein